MNKYEIAARVAVANLDGYHGTMMAAQQRAIFGRNVFGRKTITIDASGQGRVYGQYTCCFGTDNAFFEKSFEDIARLADDKSMAVIF